MGRSITFAALALAFILAAARAAPATAPEVTVLANHHRLVVVRPDASALAGVVLLIPGGDTLLHLSPSGETSSTNFVIRTRDALLAAGFAIAYMDNPSDLREAIAHLRSVAKPIVILSTSRGTIVAAQNAARLGADGPDLLILTSPVTVTMRFNSLADVNLKPITIPTLVVTNTGDTCRVSPPGGAAGLVSRLGGHVDFVQFSSSQIIGDPCEPFAPHGYLGIESEVLAKIIDWIKQSS